MAREQVQRLLTLVPYLLSHPGTSVADVAEMAGTSTSQILADLSTLQFCGLPGLLPGDLIEVDIEAARGEGVIHVGNAEPLSRPLCLNADEGFALVTALDAIRGSVPPQMAADVDSAVAKLAQALGGRLEARAEIAEDSDPVRRVVAEALADRRRLRMVYDAWADTMEPEVDPARVLMVDGRAYLQAWSLTASDWRHFRLDRIAEAEMLGPADDHGDPPDLPAEGWAGVMGSRDAVEIVLAPGNGWVVEHHVPLSQETLPDGSIRARFAVADERWLRRLLLRLGPAVLSVDPPRAARAARDAAGSALGARPTSDASAR